jgi:3-methyladenine DNA glycosylase AlkD
LTNLSIRHKAKQCFNMVAQLRQDLNAFINPLKAAFYPSFFKTGKGEYGEGDIFLGITVPQIRAVVKKYETIATLPEIQALILDPVHEMRSAGLFILVNQFIKTNDPSIQKAIFDFYLSNTQGINNWDLVDCSAAQIVGAYLYDKDRTILYELVQSSNFWEQRIAIIATFFFIRKGQYRDTISLTTILVHHPHDLIQKAVGWMLREVGKRDLEILKQFLNTHYQTMPRTMLRYAIEKFPEAERQAYLKK